MAAALLGKLIQGVDLSFAEMQGAMAGIMEGLWTPAQIGGFLIALRIKGETAQEIAAAVSILREKATVVPTSAKPVVDTCGTGGDHSGSFNISTAAAIVAAGCQSIFRTNSFFWSFEYRNCLIIKMTIISISFQLQT